MRYKRIGLALSWIVLSFYLAHLFQPLPPALAQPITPPGVVWVTVAPTGSCRYGPIWLRFSAKRL